MSNLVLWTYKLGWVAFAIALVYRALVLFAPVERIAAVTGVAPKQFLELALSLFVICVATDARSRVRAETPAEMPRAEKKAA